MSRVRLFLASLSMLACSPNGAHPDHRGVDSVVAVAEQAGEDSASASSSELRSCAGANVTCYRDTAFIDTGPDYVDAYPSTNWLLFGVAGDSVEIETIPTMSVAVRIGAEAGSSTGIHPTSVAHRMATHGIIRVNVFPSSSSDSIPYVLRVRRWDVSRPAGLQTSGRAAKLTVTAARTAQPFTLVPISAASRPGSPASWTIYPGKFKIALGGDSLYEVCAVPCERPDTIRLTPSKSMTVRQDP